MFFFQKWCEVCQANVTPLFGFNFKIKSKHGEYEVVMKWSWSVPLIFIVTLLFMPFKCGVLSLGVSQSFNWGCIRNCDDPVLSRSPTTAIQKYDFSIESVKSNYVISESGSYPVWALWCFPVTVNVFFSFPLPLISFASWKQYGSQSIRSVRMLRYASPSCTAVGYWHISVSDRTSWNCEFRWRKPQSRNRSGGWLVLIETRLNEHSCPSLISSAKSQRQGRFC